MKNDSSRFGHIIQLFTVLLTAILISLFFGVLVLVGKIQGTARVVNYAGLVRGKTQRIVKLEISGTPEDDLLGDVASYIEGLRFGSSELDLVQLDDADFQAKMTALSSEFDDLRNELILVRQRGYTETAIIAKSEHFFQTCDEATNLAEVYSQKRATALDFLEKVVLADIVGLLLLFGYQIFKALRYAAMNRILQRKVYLDEATGLPNKNKCEELLDAPDPPDGNTALCVFDLNNLRTVNNNLGHDKGDEYIRSFAETLLATHPDLAARQLDPPLQYPSWERYEPEHEQMVRTGAVSADITLETSIGMSDEAFAAALAAAKQQGRSTVHVRVWLPLPAACPAQSNIMLDSFTEPPTHIAPEDAAQRTAYWEADLAENRRFGAVYSYRTMARYADPLHMQADPVQPDFDTQEELPHLEFTPYLRALAAQLTQGLTDPVQKAKRIYDYVTLNTHYHYQPPYFVQENITDGCAHNRRGDCGIMASTFIVLCRLAGIPAQWQSGLVVRREMVGCHDWAAFYIAPHGWMYADCSAGASMARAGNEKMRLHYFGNLDTGRMVANRALCAPFDPPMCSFRADPCDNQVGEVEADGVGLYGEQLQWSQTLRRYETL